MKNFAAWFTPERRQSIQVWFGSLAPLFILLGFATQDVTEQVLIIIGAVLQFVSSAVSLVNVSWQSAVGVLRGAVYALAATVAPALVLLGVFDEQTSATLLTGLSLALSSLSSLLAVFTVSKQAVAVEREHLTEVETAAARMGVLPADLRRSEFRAGPGAVG